MVLDAHLATRRHERREDKKCKTCIAIREGVASERNRANEYLRLFQEEREAHAETRELLYKYTHVIRPEETKRAQDAKPFGGYESTLDKANRLSQESLKRKKENDKKDEAPN